MARCASGHRVPRGTPCVRITRRHAQRAVPQTELSAQCVPHRPPFLPTFAAAPLSPPLAAYGHSWGPPAPTATHAAEVAATAPATPPRDCVQRGHALSPRTITTLPPFSPPLCSYRRSAQQQEHDHRLRSSLRHPLRRARSRRSRRTSSELGCRRHLLPTLAPPRVAPRHPSPPFLPTCASAVLLVAGDRAWPLLAIAVVDAPRPTAERHAHGQWRGGAAPARSKHRCSVAGGDAARPNHRSVSGATCCGVSARR